MRLSNEVRLYPLKYAGFLLRHMGPEFWIVAAFPFYISWIWGSGEIFPGWDWLAENPTYAGRFWSHFVDYLHQTWEFWIGVIIVGPLLGGGTVLYDDYFDRDIDVENPRKLEKVWRKAPASPRLIMGGAWFLFLLSLILAGLISLPFLCLCGGIVLMAILYATPPVRFKARGGMDLVINMVGFGVLCSLAGFVISAPIDGYPWPWLIPMLFGTGCLYVLTTIADMEADGASQVPTIAVKVGFEDAVKLAMVLLLVANIAILGMGLAGYHLYGPQVVYRVWPISVLEFVPLFYLLRHENIDAIMWVIFATGALMAIGTFMLGLANVGIWSV
jgi:4-hydroxybenzoate polyprenyltransferase